MKEIKKIILDEPNRLLEATMSENSLSDTNAWTYKV
jgi:hypothetical protein